MDLILYLTTLLQTRKTVGIVGLGTLYKQKSPGKYDAAQHAFIPPSYTLAFTSELKEDTELASYISYKRNITIDSANYYIGEFAEQLQSQLADHQEAALGALGKLKLVNDEITLVTDQETNFGFEFYGLPTVPEINQPAEIEEPIPVIEEEKLEEIEEENKLEEENPGQESSTEEVFEVNDEQPVYDEISEINHYPALENELNESPILMLEKTEEPILENSEEVEEEEVVEEEKKGTPFIMKFLVVFLILVAAGAIAYFINPPFFDKYLQKNFEGKSTRNVPTAAKDSLTTKVDSNQIDSVAKNNALVTLVKDSTTIDSTKNYYEVIGTSESTEKAANNYIARVAKKGIVAKHFKMSSIRFTVSLGTFTDQKQALKFRDSTRVLLKNPGIWVHPVKPKKHTK